MPYYCTLHRRMGFIIVIALPIFVASRSEMASDCEGFICIPSFPNEYSKPLYVNTKEKFVFAAAKRKRKQSAAEICGIVRITYNEDSNVIMTVTVSASQLRGSEFL